MTLAATDQELFRIAHRAWTQFNHGLKPAEADVTLLRSQAFSS